MSISAANCTPIKPQVSFGQTTDDMSYGKPVLAAQNLEDSFTSSAGTAENEEPQKKSLLGIAGSVAAAAAVMYGSGRLVASKAVQAFPELAPKLESGLKVAANKAKDKFVTLSGKENKVVSTIGKGAEKAEAAARNLYKNRIAKGEGVAEAVKSLAGYTALATGLPKILTTDGNGDGIKDITQKNANAYRNTADQIGVFSSLINEIS